MSYTRINLAADDLDERRVFLPGLTQAARVAIWSVANALLVFAEHLAELFAPFLLLGGAIWWAIPRGLAAITLEGQANDMLQIMRSHVPHDVYIDGSYYSSGTLIWDGVFLVAVVAICRTLSTAITTLLLDRR
jgi:hypothetical protein